MKKHEYQIKMEWSGNTGAGTKTYDAYSRDHVISTPQKVHKILSSSDPSFRGNADRYNPEELFLSSLSACHMLWYLHVCTTHGIVVETYVDHAEGIMEETHDGGGHFKNVTLKPVVTISLGSAQKARSLHEEANKLCFIANSCNFPIKHEPTIHFKP